MSSVQLGPIGHIALHIMDVGRSLKFYRDQLGMTKLFDAPSLAFFANAGVRLMKSAGESEPSGARSVIYDRVDDIDAAHLALMSETGQL